MADGRSKKISELPTVNTVANSDLIVVNANVSGNVVTSAISVYNFAQSAVGNVIATGIFTTSNTANVTVVANSTQNVAYFSYNRTLYAGVSLIIDAYSNSDGHRVFGGLVITANSTVANCSSGATEHVHIGGNPIIDLQKNAYVSGNTVTICLDGPTGNVQVRYIATYFRV